MILKLPFTNANVYVLIAQKEQLRKKIACRGGSFPAVPVGSCCHVQRRERTPTGPVGSPSRARQEHVVGTTGGESGTGDTV